MKGLELPLNMIVLIVIAVLVLLVVGAFFTAQTTGGFTSISDSAALNRGCQLWRGTQCQVDYNNILIPNYRPGGVATDASLAVACTRNGFVDAQTCRTQCVCP